MLYTPDQVLNQMKNNAVKYLSKTVKINPKKGELTLPAIFEWFAEDFKRGNQDDDLFYFLATYLPPDKAAKINEVFALR